MTARFEFRPDISTARRTAAPVAAIGLTLLSGLVLALFAGIDPGKAFHAFFIAPIDDLYGVGELVVKATPLALIALGLAVGFRANVWNIGAEGQLTIGAIAGGGIALLAGESSAPWLLSLMVAAGALGGMAWAAIPALLRTRFNTNEILVSLMLNYVALLILSYLTHGPWRDPDGFNFPETKLFSEAAILPVLVEGTRLHLGAVFVLAALVITWVFSARAFSGFQMLVGGLAEPAARYAGFSRNRMIWIGLLAGGAAAGVAGLCEVAGPIGQLLPSISPGYGYAAIIVAFVGRLHPLGILGASMLMSLLYLGGESAQMALGLPSAVTGIFQGILLFFLLAAQWVVHFRLNLSDATPGKRTPGAHAA
ncbi:MAG: ABC-type uncharacterized transport system permease subunit [Gammaproteobacteria bacterium]|jgi:ABC-type uncharacterized transport system permease subunit